MSVLEKDLPANADCHNAGCALSIVVPVFNERESVEELYEQIVAVLEVLSNPAQLVFVDDGSTDGSWQVIQQLGRRDDRVCGIRLRRNCGKAAALSIGFSRSVGDLIITMDADLQDDPREIPRFLAEVAKGFDAVSGWKAIRHDPWHKTIPSKFFNWMVGFSTGTWLHDHNCGFKCYRRQAIRDVQLYGEFHRFMPVLIAAEGFHVGEISVNHRPRKHGSSKYGWRRFARGFLDLLTVKFLTSYENRPQHLLGGFGLLAFFGGTAGLALLVVEWLLTYAGVADFGPIGNRPLLILSATSLLLGVQMLSLGLIAELITARQSRRTSDRFVCDTLAENTSERSI